MHISKRLIISCFIVMVLSLVGCSTSGGEGESDDYITENFSYFQGQAEDTQFYADYSGNPVIQYLESLTWNKNDDGKDVKLNFEFQSAVVGSETEITNTMLATGSYTDIMDMSHYTGSIQDLYNDGVVMDLTYYVENYMPNYLAFLDAHPEYGQFSTQNIDGELKYLQLYTFHDYIEPYWGINYRRDWIVKYADEVYNCDPFSRWEDSDGNYYDDVIFPNGTQDPIFISDWEWMMRIFDYALDAEGIDDGYVMSLYYPGYIRTGDMMTGAGDFYQSGNTIVNGTTSDEFRAYLQMTNTWYQNGWIDEHFAERTNEMFFQTGINYFMTGRVGIWYGGTYAQDDALETGLPNSPENGYTEDIFVWSAPQPINDMYGDESVQNIIPFAFYYPELQFNSVVITSAAEGKDLVALFSLFDYLFSEEGSFIAAFGLNAEQYEITQNELMSQKGFSDGVYDFRDVDGVQKVRFRDELQTDDKLRNALILNRFLTLQSVSSTYFDYSITKRHSMEMISLYTETGGLLESFVDQLSSDNAETYSKTTNNINSFLERNIPNFINGTKDPFSDEDWNAYVSAVNKFNPEAVREMLQELLDEYSEE